MARIFIRHKDTGQIKNVESVILTDHLKARGWVLHEVEKFEPKAKETAKEAVNEPVKTATEPELKTIKETKNQRLKKDVNQNNNNGNRTKRIIPIDRHG